MQIKNKIKDLKEHLKENEWKWFFEKGDKNIHYLGTSRYNATIKITPTNLLDVPYSLHESEQNKLVKNGKFAKIEYQNKTIALISRFEINDKFEQIEISNRKLRAKVIETIAEFAIREKSGLFFNSEYDFSDHDKVSFFKHELLKLKEEGIKPIELQTAIDALANYLKEQEYTPSYFKEFVICEQPLINDEREIYSSVKHLSDLIIKYSLFFSSNVELTDKELKELYIKNKSEIPRKIEQFKKQIIEIEKHRPNTKYYVYQRF